MFKVKGSEVRSQYDITYQHKKILQVMNGLDILTEFKLCEYYTTAYLNT